MTTTGTLRIAEDLALPVEAVSPLFAEITIRYRP